MCESAASHQSEYAEAEIRKRVTDAVLRAALDVVRDFDGYIPVDDIVDDGGR